MLSIIHLPLRLKVRGLEKINKRNVAAQLIRGIFNKTFMDEVLLAKFVSRFIDVLLYGVASYYVTRIMRG